MTSAFRANRRPRPWTALATAALMLISPTGVVAQSDTASSERVMISEPQVLDSRPQILLPAPERPREEVYDRAREQVSPLTEEEIVRFREEMQRKQDTINETDNRPATRSCLEPASLAAGASAPVVEVVPGYVTSMVFVDSHGNPWPIQGDPVIGNPDLYAVSVVDGGENQPAKVMNISARASSGATNLSVVLEGQGLPVQVELRTNRSEGCLRAEIQIDERGPQTGASDLASGPATPAAPTPAMTRFVAGTPPRNAVELEVDQDALRVWQIGSEIFVRTRQTLISPSWQAVAHGSGGVRVYRLSSTPMILYTEGGQTQRARIELRRAAPSQEHSP